MNMQVLQASWTGKRFALARCSDSKEKKTRRRRSKEEKRSMAESFIHKYRTLNNGKFPSLNLTHKLVGGSFYSVREIVREIIQENRVLGPGNLTSKSYSLESCLEEDAGGPFSMDIPGQLFISTFNHAIDQRQLDSCALASEQLEIIEGSIEIGKSVIQESFASHSNEISVSQVLVDGPYHPNTSDSTELHGNGEPLWSKEANLQKVSEQTDGKSRVYEQAHAEVSTSADSKICEIVKPIPVCQNLSINSALGEFEVNGDDTDNRGDRMAKAGKFAAEFVGVDSMLEADTLLKSVPASVSDQVQHYSYDKENSSLAPPVGKTCDSEKSHETEGLPWSVEVSTNFNCAEVVGAFKYFEKDSTIKRSESTEMHSSCAAEEVSSQNLNISVSQSLDSPPSIDTRSEVEPVQSSDLENVIPNIRNESGESIEPGVKRANLEVKGNHEHMVHSIASDSSSGSSSSCEANEDPKTSEINPLWDAIMGFVAAVIKFWKE